jgi:hypothetical protein
MPPSKPEAPLTEPEARELAAEFRARFRDRETFDAAWQALFELKTAITPSLARRFLQEEFVKYRARLAGLTDAPSDPRCFPPPQPDTNHIYRCPGCERQLSEWSRAGHADTCPYHDCYELEVRFSHAKAKQDALRASS